MLGIRIALVRVSRRTVLAKRGSVATPAIEPLVDSHAVAEAEVAHLCAQFDYLPGDFVAENLRLAGERNRLTALIGVVVGLTSIDMEVGTAQPDGRHAKEHIAWPESRYRHVAHLKASDVVEHACAH
jgi:hypothetical protein